MAGLSQRPSLHQIALQALLAYGAVILLFLGGIRWGLVIVKSDYTQLFSPLSLSVAPAIVGWIALLIPAPAGLIVLALSFSALLLLDLRSPAAPLWYGALRVPLSVAAIAALLLGLLI